MVDGGGLSVSCATIRPVSKSLGRPLRLTNQDLTRWRSYVVETAGCAIWVGAVGSDGYGRFKIHNNIDGDRMVTPHQIAARLAFGPIPVGATILHDCDVRICCATTSGHIRIATQRENVQQAVARGRSAGPRPGAVDERGPVGASRAVQDAIQRAVADGITDRFELADVLARAVAAGDPYRRLVPLFDHHELESCTADKTAEPWDDAPVDLLDPRARADIMVVESVPLF